MAKRKTSPAEDMVFIVYTLLGLLILIIFKILSILYYFIIYKKNSYKEKSELSFFKVYFNKGNYGEFKLFLKLKSQNAKENMFVNVYLLHNGSTDETEIDVLTINQHGIYVYEMKNYSGYIYGRSSDKNWTQVLGRKKYPFFNPFRQNYAHIKALESALPEYKKYIKPIVVFSNRCNLKKVSLNNTDVMTRLCNVKKIINKNTPAVLTEEQIKDINNKLFKISLTKSEVQEKHIIQVKAIQEN